MVVTKFSRQKPVRFWAFRLTHPYQSHYFLSCEIFFHGFVSLELALIIFEVILTNACMNMIKALFVISYIKSQIAYLVINFSLYWTPLSFVIYCEPTSQDLNPKKQYLYPSRKDSGALFIIMICIGVQEISVGVSGFVVWLRLVKWNMVSFSIRELHCWGNFEKKRRKKEEEMKWWRKLLLILRTVHVHNSS
jgi:NADH:ubiquinone oxidoreductase subunit K